MQMLPFGGQGSNQAMEDGGALGTLLAGVHHAADVPERLAIFEDIRRLRASRVQILSRVRIGTEVRVRQELEAYCKPGDTGEATQLFSLSSLTQVLCSLINSSVIS
jgi:salicylate hydroxylase